MVLLAASDDDRTLLGDRSLKNDVCAEIVRMLHHGQLQPGDRISEADIASRLGISRSPVREAFVQLAHEGVIVRKPRSGNFIAQRTNEELVEIQETRLLIEVYSARIVAQIRAVNLIRDLTEIVEAMGQTEGTPNWSEGTRLNALFHETVVGGAGNSALFRIWKSLDPLAWLLAPWAIPKGTLVQNDLVSRHEPLVNALESGTPDRAAEAFASHIIKATPLDGAEADRSIHALEAAAAIRRR